MAIIVVLAILVAIALFLYNNERRPKNFPPGPVGYPIVGYLPFLGDGSHADIGKIGKKYGDIFSLKMGSYWYVVLNDFDLIKNALKDDVFTGRPNYLLRMSFYKKGISYNNGANWQAQRRFSMKVLKDFGFGKMSMIKSIQDEIRELQSYLRENTEQPIDLSEVLPISILNSLWNILTGGKFSLSDSLPKKIHHVIKYGLSGQEVLGVLYFLPWLEQLIPGKTSGTDKMKLAVDTLHAVLKATIDEHRQRFVPGTLPKDYIDAYLQKIEECDDPASSFYDEEGVLNLIDGLTNFCVPGTDTISSSMSFALLYVASSRDVLKKIHAEIDAVIGRERLPDPADRPNMPYMSAVVNETFRLSSIIPGGVPHSATADTKINGYTLPKGTIIMPNIYQVHHDEKYWGDPQNFRPERFLNADGTLRKEERVIPFSIGKRVCVAEGLAQVQFFLFLTGILQHFDLIESPDHPLPGFNAKSTFSLSPQPYKLVLRERA
ncbi:farnesoate epoxidase-like [Bradysia coprophila]|uniref:farnesoate epoxidase-like n=1 Tax=Bradysia coprophila TaxID=38358 RepID=UPI00187D90D2|nr:farnesoate epoxidase-like [Bradysia coprophila]